ncbi:MAG: hypothetical protein ABIA04_07240 [Pseudomonadota bacterium]
MIEKKDLTKMELSTRVLKSVFVYIRREYGVDELSSFTQKLSLPFDYLRDENNWVSWKFYKEFLNELVSFTSDPESPYKAGLYAASKDVWGSFFFIFKLLKSTRIIASPKSVFKKVVETNSKFNKSASWDIINSTDKSIKLKILWNNDFKADKNCCINRQ